MPKEVKRMNNLISLYEPGTKDFDNNGDYVLNNIIKDDNLKWGLFDQWELTITIPVNNELGVVMRNEQIIKVKTPNFDEPQLFYISHIERTLDEWEVTAIHIYNKLKHIFLPGSLIRSKTLVEAVNQLILYQGLDLQFNITTDKPSAKVDTNFKMINALQAIADESLDNSIITQTETEFTANNFNIQLLSQIGTDRGADVRYGRDLLSFKETVDATNLVGRVIPTGNNGFTIPESSGGPYVECSQYNPLIHQTKVIEYKEVVADYGEDKDKDNALPISEAIRQLRRLGEREFTLSNIQEPLISYTLDIYDLRTKFKGLQKIKPGDTISIIDNKGTIIKERIIGYTYKPTTQKYTGLTLANKTPEITAGERAKRVYGGGTLTL